MTNLLFKTEKKPIPNIPGLKYWPDFITTNEESTLIENINQQPWLNDLKRRVQHYGYQYDYKARAIANGSYLGPLPEWIKPFCNLLHVENIFDHKPDQVIINEYLPGQGIAAHVDCVPCFGDMIASLSLGSSAVMQFTMGNEKKEIYLEPCSLITLSGKARYEWTHAIPARKTDVINGFRIERNKRISLTFRNIILN